MTSAVKQLREKCWYFNVNYLDTLKNGWGEYEANAIVIFVKNTLLVSKLSVMFLQQVIFV